MCQDQNCPTILESELKTHVIQQTVLGAGGYYATFNNSIDIPAAKLYQTGVKLPLRRGDFVNFVKKNMMDTSEACRILECTRQNLSYMVNKGSLKPVKEDVKGNLYQKGNLYNLDE